MGDGGNGMVANHRNWVSVFIVVCTVARSLEILRPGAEWSVSDSTVTWLDKTQTKPTLAEILDGIAQCRDQQNQMQNDIFNINLATNTITQKFPSLIDLLKQRGQLQ